MFSNSIVRRYAVFLCGVATTGFSISLITKAGLGTPPISSLPYVLCEIFSFSFGTFTFVFNLALIFGQLLLLKKEFTPAQYLQIPVTLLFSCVIDVVMFLLSGLTVEAYPARIALLLAGCVTLGFGIALQVVAEARPGARHRGEAQKGVRHHQNRIRLRHGHDGGDFVAGLLSGCSRLPGGDDHRRIDRRLHRPLLYPSVAAGARVVPRFPSRTGLSGRHRQPGFHPLPAEGEIPVAHGSVFGGGVAGDLFEDAGEIEGIREAETGGGLLDAELPGAQQLAGGADQLPLNVFAGRDAEIPAEE